MMLSKSHQLVFALLLCTSRVAAIGTIPQIILNEPNPCPNPPSGNQCGFWYPGLYRIINYGFQYAATMNDSTPGAAVVSMYVFCTRRPQQETTNKRTMTAGKRLTQAKQAMERHRSGTAMGHHVYRCLGKRNHDLQSSDRHCVIRCPKYVRAYPSLYTDNPTFNPSLHHPYQHETQAENPSVP